MPLHRRRIPPLSYALHNAIDAKGEQMIYLRYYIAGMYKFRTTGFKIKPEYWDAKKQRVLPDAPDAALTNKRLDRMMEAAFGAFCDYDGPRSSAKLDELLDRTYVCERDAAFITPFEQYAGKVNDKRFNDGKLQYRAWYDKKNYIKAFERYVHWSFGHRSYFLNEVCASDIEGYIAYRRQVLGNTSDELVAKSLQPLVVAVEAACEDGLISKKQAEKIRAVYDDFREPLPEQGKEKQEFLSRKDIAKLEEYLNDSIEWKYFEAVGIFFFSYYACGMKFADILTLRWEDVAGKYIIRRSPRTGVQAAILPPVTERVMKILHYWEDRHPLYVFGLIDESIDTKALATLREIRTTKNNEINRNLRHVGRELGISRNLTLSVARDSFVAHALDSGISLYTISKLIGHSSLDETAKRYHTLMEAEVEKDLGKLI